MTPASTSNPGHEVARAHTRRQYQELTEKAVLSATSDSLRTSALETSIEKLLI